jgi:DNA-binding response OmpR family regulator
MKILIIEDEPALKELMENSLEKELYIVESAGDYYSAKEKIGIYQYDCILLDIGLPGGSGLALLEEIKQQGIISGVIIVSAKDSVEDKIHGLNLGADDYLPKPFHMAELHARVKSVIRRRSLGGNNGIRINNLAIEVDQRKVTVDEIEVILNRKEFDILNYMAMNHNRLVNKSALAEHVWGDYIDSANSFDFVYSQIKHLRKKLKESNAKIEIQAIYGIGYKLIG